MDSESSLRTKKTLVFLAVGISALAVLVLYGPSLILSAVVSSFGDAQPSATITSRGLSPDSKWEYTLEHLDNGLGFGQGRLVYEVHVHKPDANQFKHGDPDPTSVFYALEEKLEQKTPKVQWIGSRRLLIECDVGQAGKALTSFDEITIEYRK